MRTAFHYSSLQKLAQLEPFPKLPMCTPFPKLVGTHPVEGHKRNTFSQVLSCHRAPLQWPAWTWSGIGGQGATLQDNLGAEAPIKIEGVNLEI